MLKLIPSALLLLALALPATAQESPREPRVFISPEAIGFGGIWLTSENWIRPVVSLGTVALNVDNLRASVTLIEADLDGNGDPDTYRYGYFPVTVGYTLLRRRHNNLFGTHAFAPDLYAQVAGTFLQSGWESREFTGKAGLGASADFAGLGLAAGAGVRVDIGGKTEAAPYLEARLRLLTTNFGL